MIPMSTIINSISGSVASAITTAILFPIDILRTHMCLNS